jgi:hypothetical protein
MATYYTSAPEVQEIARAAFPDYNGKKFGVAAFEGPMNLASHWDGGSRIYYAVINLDTKKSAEIPQSGTMFDKETYRMTTLPPNMAVVAHSIFSGKDMGVTIYVNPESLTKMLPAPDEVTWAEKVVLAATRGLKSSYAGIKDYRFREALKDTGITRVEWDQAKESLIQKGMLNKAGAIQDKGKNAIGHMDLYRLKRPTEEQPKPLSPPVIPDQLPPTTAV